jgi:hypothetical protein
MALPQNKLGLYDDAMPLMPGDLPRDLDGLWRATEQHVFDAAFGPAPSRRMPDSFANEEAEVFGDIWK